MLNRLNIEINAGNDEYLSVLTKKLLAKNKNK